MQLKPEARVIIDRASSEGRKFITEPEAKSILRAYGVTVTNESLCLTAEDAVRAAEIIGYPVVLKLISPQIVHKTEFKAVKLDVRTPQEVRGAFEEMTGRGKKAGYQIQGVLVSETASGTELIIGGLRDPQFGPMVMLGLGGIYVEVYRDVAYRLAPVDPVDVKDMLSELKGKKMIDGFRGREGVDQDSIVDAMVAVSKLVSDVSEIEELDLNPVFGDSRGIKVADARMLLR